MMPSFDTPFIPSSYTFPPLGPSKPSSPSTDVHLNETFNLKSNNTNDTLANHKSSIPAIAKLEKMISQRLIIKI